MPENNPALCCCCCFSEYNVTYDTAQPTDFSISPVGRVTFPAGSGSQTIRLKITDDSETEDAESFTLTLVDPDNKCQNSNLGKNFKLHLTINANDGEQNSYFILYFVFKFYTLKQYSEISG